MDYLYLLDGTLYLKKTHLRNTTKIVDTRITINSIDLTMTPTAPDFFHENTPLSNIFSFSYDTTDDSDSMWRVEFYDKYMEWDMLKQ